MAWSALLLLWILPGWLLGLAIATYLCVANELLPRIDANVVRIYLVSAGAGALEGALAGGLAVAVGTLLARRRASAERFALHAALAAGVWWAWLLVAPTLESGLSPRAVWGMRAVAAGGALALPGLVWWLLRRDPLRRRLRPLGPLASVLLLAPVVATLVPFARVAASSLAARAGEPAAAAESSANAATAAGYAPFFEPLPGGLERASDGGRVLVVGMDGLSWDALQPMIDAGRAPHFAELQRSGAWGPLATLLPTWSPRIWTSMVTGRRPEAHRVLLFHETQYPRLGIGGLNRYRPLRYLMPILDRFDSWQRVPVSSRARKVKALWNLATEAGVSVGVVGWFATFPAEPVNGFIVSEYAYKRVEDQELASSKKLADRFQTYPEGLIEELEPYLRTTQEVGPELLAPFVRLRPEDREHFSELLRVSLDEGKQRYRLQQMAVSVLWDQFGAGSALHLLERYRPDAMLVLLRAVDAFGHMTFELSVPDAAKYQDAADVERFAGSIDAAIAWLDGWLGRFLESADQRTSVFVVSDHGWGFEGFQDGQPIYGHDQAQPGIFLAAGHDIRPVGRIDGVSVLDVAPTLFYLLGLPLSEELPGRVLEEIIEPTYLSAYPPREIATYEVAEPETRLLAGGEKDEQLIDQLRALGYLE